MYYVAPKPDAIEFNTHVRELAIHIQNTEHCAHVEDFRHMLISQISDMGKEEYGVRPRWLTERLYNAPLYEVNEEFDRVWESLDDHMEMESEWQLHEDVLCGNKHFSEEWTPEPAPINNPFAVLKVA